jgi:hypothetical protein
MDLIYPLRGEGRGGCCCCFEGKYNYIIIFTGGKSVKTVKHYNHQMIKVKENDPLIAPDYGTGVT